MRILGVDFNSVVNGDGVRVVVFFAGCKHNCGGCHNPSSHCFSGGQEFTAELQQHIINYVVATPLVSGITLSGGDPMFSANNASEFVQALREAVPNISVWVYSGYLYEEIVGCKSKVELLRLCDVLVDGRFDEALRDTATPYRGSKNQRIVDIKRSMTENKIVLWEG